MKTVYGVLHGKTIELHEDLGVPEGQEVVVQVEMVKTERKWGEGIRGGIASTPPVVSICR